MRSYKFLLSGICAFIFFICPVFAQKTKPTPKPEKTETSLLISKRLSQIERLNEALLNEKSKLALDEKVFLFANLAKIWKDENPATAKDLLKNAVKELSPRLTDDVKEKTLKIDLLRKLLPLSGQIDSKITEQIINQLKSGSEAQPNQPLQNSVALTEASLAVVKTNPQLSFDLAVAALNYLENPSQNEQIYNVVLALGLKDKKLSEELLLRVLRLAQNASDIQAVGRIALFASPNSYTVETDFLSDNSKRYVLSVFLENLLRLSALSQQKQLPDEQKEQGCVFFLIGKGLSETINTYLPEKTALLSQTIQQSDLCRQASSSSSTQSVMDELNADKNNLTAEELIQLANDTDNIQKKAFYLTIATGKLSKEKKFEKVLELLDNMDEETKKAMGTGNDDAFWRAERNANALDAVFQKLDESDFGAANRIIEKTPSDLRPMLQIQVSRQILEKVSKVDYSNPKQSFAFTLISDARQKLPNITDPFSGVNLYLSLIRRYSLLLPDEVTLVFRETVKAVNRADSAKDEKKYQGKDFAYGESIIPLPIALLENNNENIILIQLEDVQKTFSRVRLKLGLLSASISKYREEKKKFDEEKTPRQSSKTNFAQ